MFDPRKMAKAVRLAQKGFSTPEISERLTIDVHQLRMLFAELRKAGADIPRNRRGKVKDLIRRTKKILKI